MTTPTFLTATRRSKACEGLSAPRLATTLSRQGSGGGANDRAFNAHVLLALARIAAQGLDVSLIPLSDSPANVRLSGTSGRFDLCVAYPFNFDADATEMAIRGGARPRMSEPGYIVLGTSGRAGRPALAQISQAVARPVVPLQAAVATEPLVRAVYNEELTASETTGTLSQLLQQIRLDSGDFDCCSAWRRSEDEGTTVQARFGERRLSGGSGTATRPVSKRVNSGFGQWS